MLEKLSQRDAKTLEQKGKLLYDTGHPQQALRDYTKCALLEPWNMDCQLHKALSNLNMGRFFQGVKDLTVKGMPSYFIPTASKICYFDRKTILAILVTQNHLYLSDIKSATSGRNTLSGVRSIILYPRMGPILAFKIGRFDKNRQFWIRS